MRETFIQTLCALAEQKKNLWLLCGDLGYSVLEPFAKKFPDRYLNVGVAEQNMMGIATGLALSKKIVFVYSIANFPTFRCLEQVRNDVCYHNANVKIIAVGGGLSYGPAGYSHYGIEDFAIMRSLPAITVMAPADPVEVRAATQALAENHGPGYMRLGKTREPFIHPKDASLTISNAQVLKQGKDVAILSTGGILKIVLDAAGLLEKEGVHARVLSIPTLHPIDRQAILSAAKETQKIVTVEEHRINGGLGSAVAEILQDELIALRSFHRLGLGEEITRLTGSQDYLRERAGLTPQAIASKILSWR